MPKNKSVRAWPKADNIILMWSWVEGARSPTNGIRAQVWACQDSGLRIPGVTTRPKICSGALCRKSSWQVVVRQRVPLGDNGGTRCLAGRTGDLAIGDPRLMPCVESPLDDDEVKRRVPQRSSGGARWLADQMD